VRWLIAVVLGLGLLSGCGMKSFSDSYAVAVESPQEVSIFDSMMGESAEWAEKTMGPAAPGQPYTTQVSNLATKMFFDGSLPTSLRVGLYLPAVTDTGYYSVSLEPVVAGPLTYEAPFIPWFSETPVEPRPPLQIAMEIAEGPNGWVINMTPEPPT
jgi:hypothetical protein